MDVGHWNVFVYLIIVCFGEHAETSPWRMRTCKILIPQNVAVNHILRIFVDKVVFDLDLDSNIRKMLQ